MPAPVYCTRAMLEAHRFPVGEFTAPELNDWIRSASRYVDRITGDQHFQPLVGEFRLNGTGSTRVAHESLRVIHRLDALRIESLRTDDNERGVVDLNRGRYYDPYFDYGLSGPLNVPPVSQMHLWPERLPRYVQTTGYVFPHGAGNVVLTGILGHLEEDGRKTVTTTLAEDFKPDDTAMKLASLDGLDLKDSLQVGGAQNLLVQGFDEEEGTVLVDSLEGVTGRKLAAGTEVVCYGRPPDAACQLAIWFAMAFYQFRRQREEYGNQLDPAAIKGETVDGYTWERFNPSQLVGFGRSAGLTGVSLIDQYIHELTPPVEAVTVVPALRR